MPLQRPPIGPDERAHRRRVEWLETAREPVVALADEYPDGHAVTPHVHGRAQLLHTKSGVVLVRTDVGRWLVPAGHAMWIPAGTEHAVDMIGTVRMQSIYVAPEAIGQGPASLCVLEPSELVRSLIGELVMLRPRDASAERALLINRLLLCEIPRLRDVPLSLPMPADARLDALCRAFIDDPAAGAHIDEWATRAGMSRRTFTRAFQRETGLSLSTWRQQACLLAALPRLADGESVTSISMDLGYESAAAFTTMFRRMLGASPRAYRKMAVEPVGAEAKAERPEPVFI